MNKGISFIILAVLSDISQNSLSPVSVVDECAKKPCDANAICTNTDGGYSCQCKPGWTGNGKSCAGMNFCK